MKNINEMTKKEFLELPYLEWDKQVECNSLIIIPSSKKELHDSGYRCMHFVAVKGDTAICLLSGCSDIVNLDGIGGYGHNWPEKYDGIPQSIPPSGWSIDCLPRSGLLRIFGKGAILCGGSISNFEIFNISKENPKKTSNPA